jgi:putative inorganic carbon (HCO3(-)) transporter
MSSKNSIPDDEKSPSSSAKYPQETSRGRATALGHIHRPQSFRSIQGSTLTFILIGIALAVAVALAINFTDTYPSFLVVGGAVGLILTITIFQKPELGAYILIFTVFTNLSDLFTEKGLPSINKPLVVIVMFSIFANYVLRTGKINISAANTRSAAALLAYYLTILFSSLVAINQSKSFLSIFDLTKDIAIGICIYLTLNTKERLKTGVRVLLFAVTFVSILGVIYTLTDSASTFWGLARGSAFGQIGSGGGLRYGGPIAESNVWGQVLVSILPIALYQFVRVREPLVKMILALAALFILLAMFFTESRGAFLALVFILALIALDLRIKATTLFSLASIGLLLFFIVPSRYTERFKSLDILFNSNEEFGLSQDDAVEGRREKMLTGLAMFKENPFLGVGFANYSDNYWSYAGNLGLEASARNVGSESSARQPHSLYIEIMAETGIFGAASFAAFIYIMLWGLYRSRAMSDANKVKVDPDWSLWITSIFMSILTFLVAGIFLHGIGFRFIWVLSGLALAVIHLTQERSSSMQIN